MQTHGEDRCLPYVVLLVWHFCFFSNVGEFKLCTALSTVSVKCCTIFLASKLYWDSRYCRCSSCVILQSCMHNYQYNWLSILAILLFIKLVPYCGVCHSRDCKILCNIPESEKQLGLCIFRKC